MTIKYEYRRSLKRSGKPILKTKEECLEGQGFISTYGYPEEVQKVIEDNKGTYGLSGMPVVSDLLYIDVDDNQEAADKVFNILHGDNIRFIMYDSGSPNSYHFHIPIVKMEGPNVPAIHKQWVLDNFDESWVDTSIYRTAGIIRIEGTYHKSYPGNTKKVSLNMMGEILDLTDYKTKSECVMPKFKMKLDTDPEMLDSLFNQMLFTRDYSDSRNGYIFKLAAMAKDIGYSFDEALDKIEVYNDLMVDPQLKPGELRATVNSAYRGMRDERRILLL
jgi:hypothetical protein